MADELISAMLRGADLRVALAFTQDLCRHARTLAELRPGSAAVLARGLTAGVLLAGLQKHRARLNLQLECDGPLRGMFIDAAPDGEVRGYVKNPKVEHLGLSDDHRFRPVLGNSGFLSVLRELPDGDTYRSSVQLQHFDLAQDLEAYFGSSDQVRTHALLDSLEDGAEPLAAVGGLLLQPLPNADLDAFAALGTHLKAPGVFRSALATGLRSGAAAALKELFAGTDVEVLARFPLSFKCTCSRERVKTALLAMGREELDDLLEKEGRAEVTCQFCSTRFEVKGDELRALYGPAGRR